MTAQLFTQLLLTFLALMIVPFVLLGTADKYARPNKWKGLAILSIYFGSIGISITCLIGIWTLL